MELQTFKHKLHVMGLHVYHTHHHSWEVGMMHDIPHSRLRKETDCAEVSSRYCNYFVSKPQYLSRTAVLVIHAFASTPVSKRNDNYAPKRYYVLCSPADAYKVQDWFLNKSHKVASEVGSNEQQFIYNDKYHLTKHQLIRLENYLLAHGLGKKSLIVRPLIQEK